MATISNRFITVLGPIKMEILNVTAITTGDTVISNLANPRFAISADNTATLSVNTSNSISGKTITITNSSYAGVGVCNLLVFGF